MVAPMSRRRTGSSLLATTTTATVIVTVLALSACVEPIVVDPPPPPTPPPLEPVCSDSIPGPRAVRLLTRAEYDHTVRDLFGDESAPATTSLPPESALIGFENDGDNHRVSGVVVEELLRIAEDVAARALAERRARVLPCDPLATGEVACGQLLVESVGTRAFRRPLTASERARLTAVFEGALAAWGFEKATELTVTAALVSPQFLYRIDLGADPAATGADVVLASSYEMASRLSYFLWSSMPDEELMGAAATGELLTAAGVELQARRMLEDPRARDAVGSFFRQWLGLDRLAGIIKDGESFPEYDGRMNARWRESLARFVDGVVWQGSGTLSELFTSTTLHVDPVLASLYEVSGPSHDGFEPRAAPAGTRAGLLTQPGLMALLANPDQSSPIRRGVFVREKLLCQPIEPPPPDIVINPPPASPGLTTRERFAVHTENEQCAGCHVLIDPVGFGLESYDALGRFRTTENGLPIDASGELAYTDDLEIEGPFTGALELAEKLAASQQVRDCVMGQAFTFAMGRVPETADECTLENVRARFADSGGSLRELLVAIATSGSFRTTPVQLGTARPGSTP
jgi:hypothetical protein